MNSMRKHVKLNKQSESQIVSGIFSQCEVEIKLTSNSPLDKKLNSDQLLTLSQNDLFTIGAHTLSHKILGYCSQTIAEKEISKSTEWIAKFLNNENTHFSYPEGFAESFTPFTESILKKCGVTSSVTTLPGNNKIPSNLYRLKRINVI